MAGGKHKQVFFAFCSRFLFFVLSELFLPFLLFLCVYCLFYYCIFLLFYFCIAFSEPPPPRGVPVPPGRTPVPPPRGTSAAVSSGAGGTPGGNPGPRLHRDGGPPQRAGPAPLRLLRPATRWFHRRGELTPVCQKSCVSKVTCVKNPVCEKSWDTEKL